jgi:hypothetical protein
MVTRMRKCSSFGLHQVQVALPCGMQILIPEWMLDEDRCRGMEIVERPTLAITALFALRELIDAQPRTSEPSGPLCLRYGARVKLHPPVRKRWYADSPAPKVRKNPFKYSSTATPCREPRRKPAHGKFITTSALAPIADGNWGAPFATIIASFARNCSIKSSGPRWSACSKTQL